MIYYDRMQNLLFSICQYLKLKKPVDIQFRFCKTSEYDAEYWPKMRDNGKVKRHIIRFYVCSDLDFDREFNTLLAHELIHAYQAERGLTEIHGKHFKRLAKKLEKRFALTNIYNSELDID
jgi:SprT-like family